MTGKLDESEATGHLIRVTNTLRAGKLLQTEYCDPDVD
jgi:hypothetical protein